MSHTVRSALLAAVAAAVALTGCATEGGVNTGETPQGTNRPSDTPSDEAPESEATSEEPTEEPAEEPTTEEEPPASTNPVFGETYTWEDGVSVTIGVPAAFEPGEFAFVEDAAAYLAFQVTIVNGGTENYDPTIFFTNAQSANAEAQEVFDSGNGFEGSPSTPVLPGREVTFKIGYGVADPADIIMEVTPGFEYEGVIFTS